MPLQIPKIPLKNSPSKPVPEIPAIGLGTWSGVTPEENAAGQAWYETALEIGYRHFDTAYGYGTEPYVGAAIRTGIEKGWIKGREDVWVTTKLPNHHHSIVEKSLNESLERGGLGYYDLYLIHFPQSMPLKENENDCQRPDGTWETVEHPNINETWAQMEDVFLKRGKVRAIGVSNFSVKNLTRLLETAKIVPAVNQVEMHPHLNQTELKTFCDANGIVLTAYSPSGYQSVASDPVVKSIASAHGVSPAQVSHAWHVKRGTSAVPKSANVDRQRGNLHELPELTDEEMTKLSNLDKGKHLCNYGPGPEKVVFGWTYEQMGW